MIQQSPEPITTRRTPRRIRAEKYAKRYPLGQRWWYDDSQRRQHGDCAAMPYADDEKDYRSSGFSVTEKWSHSDNHESGKHLHSFITKLPGSNRNWTFTNKTGQTTLQTHYSPKSRLLNRPPCSSPPRGKRLLPVDLGVLADSGIRADHV